MDFVQLASLHGHFTHSNDPRNTTLDVTAKVPGQLQKLTAGRLYLRILHFARVMSARCLLGKLKTSKTLQSLLQQQFLTILTP